MNSTLRALRIPGSSFSALPLDSHVKTSGYARYGVRHLHLPQHEHSNTSLRHLSGRSFGTVSPTITYCDAHNRARVTNSITCSVLRVYNKRWFVKPAANAQSGVHEKSRHEKKWTTRVVEVPVGGNGAVTFEVGTLHNSQLIAQDGQFRDQDVVIHLPPGPTFEAITGQRAYNDDGVGCGTHAGLLGELSSVQQAGSEEQQSSITTVITVHYRLSPCADSGCSNSDYRYPAPIHDVSVAFDWIVENLPNPCSRANTFAQREFQTVEHNLQIPRISILGSGIGGSLGLMLALTQPNDIYAVAVHDPITDWVGLDDLASPTDSTTTPPAKKRSKGDQEESRLSTSTAAAALISLRTKLFRNPSGFFDAFASPLMFLRAPGRDTPLWRTARPEAEDNSGSEIEIVNAMKREGGVEVSEAETRELVHERGYGPYDDDWHTAHQEHNHDHASSQHPEDAALAQATTDLSNLSLNNHPSHPPSQHSEPAPFNPQGQRQSQRGPTSAHQSPQSPTQPSTRRRKVLRRWPPTGRPEDVELPYIKIYSTLPTQPTGSNSDMDLANVLHSQAEEMVDVMRRACFWGRESSHAEVRVGFEGVRRDGNGNGNGVGVGVYGKMVRWLRGLDDEVEARGRA